MKVLLLSALLLTAGIALLPEASAECEPNYVLHPDYCSSRLPQRVNELRAEACLGDPLGVCDE